MTVLSWRYSSVNLAAVWLASRAISSLAQIDGVQLPVVPADEWDDLRLMIEEESNFTAFTQENPKAPPEGLSVEEFAGRHIPQVSQVSHNTFEYLSPHEMRPGKHYIEALYVVDTESDKVVYFSAIDPERDTHINRIGFTFSLLDGNEEDAKNYTKRVLEPYSLCNLHGLWRGNSLPVVDASSWKRTIEAVTSQSTPGTSECLPAKPVRVDVGKQVGFSMQLSTDKSVLNGEYQVPLGQFLAVGFNDNMVNTYSIICVAHTDLAESCTADAVHCFQAHAPNRQGPTKIASESLTVKDVDCSRVGSAVIRWEKALMQSAIDGDKLDEVIQIDGSLQPLIYAYGPIKANSLEPKYHGLNNRGYLSANLLSADTALIVRSDIRDLKVVHGVMMYLIWAVNITTGALLARYARKTTWWLGAHRVLQGTSTLITIPVFYLTYSWDRVSWTESPHQIMGHVIVFTSWVQASLGTLIYLCAKMNQEYTDYVSKSRSLAAAERAAFQDLLKSMGSKWVLKAIYDPTAKGFPVGTLNHLKLLADTFFQHRRFNPILPTKIQKWIAIHGAERIFAPSHRYVGRVLPFVAMVQIFLGAQLLEANDVVLHMLIIWEVIIFILIVYKEVERRLDLPRGVGTKMRLLFGMKPRKELPSLTFEGRQGTANPLEIPELCARTLRTLSNEQDQNPQEIVTT